MVGVVAALVLVVAPLPLAPDALAAPGARTCVTSQLQQVPGVQDLSGSVPVVFIHGINSGAAIWDVSSGGSIAGQAALVKGVTAWTFDYSHQSLEWVNKPTIGPSFASAISCLARASGHKVIIVAHSMGGLAAQYAVGYPGSPAAGQVAELITIGTPYRGSALLTAMQDVISGLEATSGNPDETALAEALLSACAGVVTHTGQNPCALVAVPRSPVGTALEEDSPEIQQLPPWPTGLPVLDTAGDIRIQVGIAPLTFSHDFGDVPVSLNSATAHDTAGQAVVQHCSVTETIWQVVHSPGGCFHTRLPNDPKIVAAVLGAIRADLASSRVYLRTTATQGFMTGFRLYMPPCSSAEDCPLALVPAADLGTPGLSLCCSMALSGMHWSSWTLSEATGTGTFFIATTSSSSIPVRVSLSQPVQVCGRKYWSRAELTSLGSNTAPSPYHGLFDTPLAVINDPPCPP